MATLASTANKSCIKLKYWVSSLFVLIVFANSEHGYSQVIALWLVIITTNQPHCEHLSFRHQTGCSFFELSFHSSHCKSQLSCLLMTLGWTCIEHEGKTPNLSLAAGSHKPSHISKSHNCAVINCGASRISSNWNKQVSELHLGGLNNIADHKIMCIFWQTLIQGKH